MTTEQIENQVMDILARISGIPREEITADSKFDDLQLDSLSRIELLVDIEREFSIETPDDQTDEELVTKIHSVKDATDLVKTNLEAQNAA